MRNIFKRRRPATHRATPAPILAPADQIIAAYHRLSAEQFTALPALVKADLRESIAWELRAAS